MIQDLPEEFREVAGRIRLGIAETLGDQLVGIYLYGSALDSTFVPLRSDLDLIAVTETALDADRFARVEKWLENELNKDPAFERIQMSFLIKERVLRADPTACLFQHGEFHRSGSDGNPIVWLDFLKRGRVLLGEDPRYFLPTITTEILHDALVREVGYLRHEISLATDGVWRDLGSYRAYAILTLCRILYTHATGSLASKSEAADWVKQAHPEDRELHELIRLAREASERNVEIDISLQAIEELIGRAEEILLHGTQR